MDLYAENILEHYRNPRLKSRLLFPSPSGRGQGEGGKNAAFVEHEEVNLSCGDTVTIQLLTEDGTVKKLGWDGTGCAISQAAMSMLAEEVEGKPMDELERLSKDAVYTMLGVPIGPRRTKCALLCLHTLKNALRKAKGEGPQGWLETVTI